MSSHRVSFIFEINYCLWTLVPLAEEIRFAASSLIHSCGQSLLFLPTLILTTSVLICALRVYFLHFVCSYLSSGTSRRACAPLVHRFSWCDRLLQRWAGEELCGYCCYCYCWCSYYRSAAARCFGASVKTNGVTDSRCLLNLQLLNALYFYCLIS
jgi:hypothetical protein